MAAQITIEALLQEHRVIEPPEAFRRQALVRTDDLYTAAATGLEEFWAAEAERLHWFRRWQRVLRWNPPWVKWFIGGRLNVAYNCLDRHLATHADRVAYYWEGEPGDRRTLTYRQLHQEVCRFANALKREGVRRGDRVAIYLGMIPELPVAMLACARIGAVHSVVFGGFAADALRDRINDADASVLVTADGGWRRGQIVPLKQNADRALEGCPTIGSRRQVGAGLHRPAGHAVAVGADARAVGILAVHVSHGVAAPLEAVRSAAQVEAALELRETGCFAVIDVPWRGGWNRPRRRRPRAAHGCQL
jgi:AMP-binding enzyme/acetyl-CoA synthetase-like protein